MSEQKIEDFGVTQQKCNMCHIPEETQQIWAARLAKFKTHEIDNIDFYTIPINYHIIGDNIFDNIATNGMGLEKYYREVLIPAQTNQLQLDWNGRNPDRNAANVPPQAFRDAYGAQDKFSFYTRSITYVNADWAIIPGLDFYKVLVEGNLSNVQVLKTFVSPARRQSTELNIWVVPELLLGSAGSNGYQVGLLGFGTPPDFGVADEDGIVIGGYTMGSVANPGNGPQPVVGGGILRSPYGPRVDIDNALGRTLTHEVGHYISMRHTWGDQPNTECGAPQAAPPYTSDNQNFIPNYPRQRGSSRGKPVDANGIMLDSPPCTQPAPFQTNDGIMYQNFMDYRDDTDMVMVTDQQLDAAKLIMDGGRNRVTMDQHSKDVDLTVQALEIPPVPLAPIINPEDGHAITAVTLGGQTPTAIMQGGVHYGNFNAPVVRAGFSVDVPDNNYALSSPVNVTVSGGKYYFDGQDPDQYTVTSGSYLFQNIPSSHPMAFTMNQAGQNVVFGGQGANAVGQKTSTIDGQTYTYWHGDIILYITGPSNDFSYECYYHGPMGGQDRMKNLAT
jgi:hypothetical protein